MQRQPSPIVNFGTYAVTWGKPHWIVPSSTHAQTGTTYTVTIEPDHTYSCTCPGFMRWLKDCYHIRDCHKGKYGKPRIRLTVLKPSPVEQPAADLYPAA